MIDIEDAAQLTAWLGPVRSCVLRGGVSNKTVLVEHLNGERWVLKQALPQLRVAVDWFCTPERIDREADGLRVAAALLPGSVPRLVLHQPEDYLLAMEAVPEPHENWKAMLLRGEVRDAHVIEFARILRTLQGADFNPAFADTSYYEALRLEPYYLYTAQQCPEAAPFPNQLVADTRLRRLALVHGDYSPKNVLIYRDHLVLLDFEVIHWGDPAFDVGFAFAHFLSKAHYVEPAVFARAANLFWREYDAREGDAPYVRHSLGCLLARVAGRSTLEYLTPEYRLRQRNGVIALMGDPPPTIPVLIDRFLEEVACSPK